MKNPIQFILLSTVLLTTTAQAQWTFKNRIKGNGNVVTQQRTTTSYDQIKISGFYDVDLVAGKEGTITIKGEENLLSYVKIEVEDNVLKIYTEKDKNISIGKYKNIIITVPFEVISLVSLSGSGDVQTKNTIKATQFTTKLSGSGDLKLAVDATHFEANLSGSGDVVLTGNSSVFISKLAGSGDIDAINLKTQNADIAISGSGDVKINCSQNLKARISGSGDIKYSGDPKTKDTKISGSGEISRV